jgi:N-(2-amino-2-carboxyethyl)-L-glutamate synthase
VRWELETLGEDDPFIRVHDLLTANLYLKLEFINPVGSNDFKIAIALIRSCESSGRIKRDSVVVEAAGGSLGVALAMICAERGYRFLNFVNSNTSAKAVASMKALGAEVICASRQESPLDHVRDLTTRDAHYIWASRDGNESSRELYADLTAGTITHHFPRIDYLFVNAETESVLRGYVRHFTRWRPQTKIVGVCLETIRPAAFDAACSMVSVPQVAAVSSCRFLARSYGILVGRISGTVMAAVLSRRASFCPGEVVVAIAPDPGEPYLETIYNDDWVITEFGDDALRPELYVQLLDACVSYHEAERIRVADYA